MVSFWSVLLLEGSIVIAKKPLTLLVKTWSVLLEELPTRIWSLVFPWINLKRDMTHEIADGGSILYYLLHKVSRQHSSPHTSPHMYTYIWTQ